MDLAEARQVLWLNNYPRPLGELFDEGYLTRRRLDWAIANARDPRLREAAKVLLRLLPAAESGPNATKHRNDDLMAKRFDVGITMEQARAKLWPFAPYKSQPMGALLDAKELSLKDLGYAVETAWDPTVRKAAMALTLQRLDQIVKEPPPTTGLVEVVGGGRSYAKQQETWFTFLQGGLSGLLISGMLALVVWIIWHWTTPHARGKALAEVVSTPAQMIGFVLFLVFATLLIWIAIRLPEEADRRLQKRVDKARRGQEGEDRVLQVILQALDGSWKVFRNVRLPERKAGDLDLVLVGPPGIWALEVKNLRGEFRNIGDTWEQHLGRKWQVSSSQPSQQARRNAGRLSAFLKADGITDYVNPAVVWANIESAPAVENPMVAVWTLERLPDELGNTWHSKQMPEETRDKIVDKLTWLCNRQSSRVGRASET